MVKPFLLVVFSIILYLCGHLAVVTRWEPGVYFFYVTAWWSYIIFLDVLITRRSSGQATILSRSLPSLIVISCGFWCFFEMVNLRLENWFYINVPYEYILRYAGYFLAFGTVIPAMVLTARAVEPLFRRFRLRPHRIARYPARAIPAGILLFVLTLLFPEYLFGLAWVFAIPLIDGINYRMGHPSFMADIERGDGRRIASALLSGFICGVLWETWNSLCPVRWVYTVPFFEDMKLFEMPLPGYLGFLLFGIETVAIADLIEGLRRRRAAVMSMVCIALALSTVAFVLIDHQTVFSRTTPIERLSFLSSRTSDALHGTGVRTDLGIDLGKLGPGEKPAMDLVRLKGLGYDNYLKLVSQGINTVGDLAAADEVTVAEALHEKNLRRVRVYLKAARIY